MSDFIDMSGPSGSHIYDGGYRKYTGERLGQSAAVWSVWRQTVQRVMGLRRPARSKVLPFLSVIIAYLPAAVFVGLVALLPKRINQSVLPAYHEYYGFITAAIVLFVVFTGPEALCPDRRSRVLSLYLAAPLTRATYLLAKAMAVACVLTLVTLGPPLLLLVGRALQGEGPQGPLGFLSVFARIAGAGLMMAVFYTAVSLAVSSLTDRRAFAAGGTLLAVIGTSIVAGILVGALQLSSGWFLLNLNVPPLELVARIYGMPGQLSAQPTWLVAASVAGWSVAGFALAWWRYQRLRVTR
ncbi:MAG: type transport system permease protein [Acidimicrobiaceae bacterium]|nr:type transport system permease protein [Acidimicrobiaceae bacterium]MDQ1445867.1 type transport system permease protein [Acidimicrobiaceae bacterium]